MLSHDRKRVYILYEVEFCYDKNGKSEIVDFLDELQAKSKTSKTDKIFFYWKDNKFVLLHHFIKKSQKTPPKEISKTKSNLKDFWKGIIIYETSKNIFRVYE